MANEVIIRIYLDGPQAEIERFERTCIKDEFGARDGVFDFEALIPIPAGTENGRQWAMANWGSRGDSYGLRDHAVMGDCIDFSFCTSSDVPRGILTALAAQFPTLEGSVTAGEPNSGWCVTGSIKDSVYIEHGESALDDETSRTLGLMPDDDSWDSDDEDETEDQDEDDDEPVVFTKPEMKNALVMLAGMEEPFLNPEAAQRCSELAQQDLTGEDVLEMLKLVTDRDERPFAGRYLLDCLLLSAAMIVAMTKHGHAVY